MSQIWVEPSPDSGPGYWEPVGSQNYRNNSNLLNNTNQISCWYVNGLGGLINVGLGLSFDNGQYVVVTAKGNFSVYRPKASNFVADNPIAACLNTDALPSIYLHWHPISDKIGHNSFVFRRI
jgi:hypothetical protein